MKNNITICGIFSSELTCEEVNRFEIFVRTLPEWKEYGDADISLKCAIHRGDSSLALALDRDIDRIRLNLFPILESFYHKQILPNRPNLDGEDWINKYKDNVHDPRAKTVDTDPVCGC